jgi:dephospho-CoA kinase
MHVAKMVFKRVHVLIIAGLTGGIASGKTTVSSILYENGAVILDADIIARQVVMPGQPAWRDIRDAFGEAVLHADGTINRILLGELVFNNPQLRRQLEKIIHPQVRARMDAQVNRLKQTAPHAVVIKDIPLLFESQMSGGLAEIIVVYAPMALQLQRLVQRDGLAIEAARARIKAQIPIEEKCRRATIIINNSGDPAATRAQAMKVYADLAARA